MEILLCIAAGIFFIYIVSNFTGDREYKRIRNKLLKSRIYTDGTCHKCGAKADVTMTIGTYYINCDLNRGYDVDMKLYCVNCGNARLEEANGKISQFMLEAWMEKAMMYSAKFRGIQF